MTKPPPTWLRRFAKNFEKFDVPANIKAAGPGKK